MLLVRKKEQAEDRHVKLVAYTNILYISSLFVPFIVVASYQSWFIFLVHIGFFLHHFQPIYRLWAACCSWRWF